MCLRAKDHLEGTKVAVFPRYCAELKVQTGSAAAGGHRGVATRKTTGDLTTRRGAGDPERRAEWMTVSRYGHLRSAPVVALVYARSGTTPRRASLLDSTCFGASSMAYRLSAKKVTDSLLSSSLDSARSGSDCSRTSREMQRCGKILIGDTPGASAGELSRRSREFSCLRAVWVAALLCSIG